MMNDATHAHEQQNWSSHPTNINTQTPSTEDLHTRPHTWNLTLPSLVARTRRTASAVRTGTVDFSTTTWGVEREREREREREEPR